MNPAAQNQGLKPEIYAPDLPWNTMKVDEVGRAIMNHVQDHEAYFRHWAQIWYENFQFLFGNHNIRWSRKNGYAVDYDTVREAMNTNSAFMRASTNLARPGVEGLVSLIYSNMPDWETESAEKSSIKGKRWARICQKLLDCLMERLTMDVEFGIAAFYYVMFGQFAWRADWNWGAGQLLEIPRMRKITAEVMSTYMAPNQYTGGLLESPTKLVDLNGQPISEDRWENVVDEMGRQIIDKVLAGAPRVDTLSPFEYTRALGSPGMHKTNYVRQFRLMDYDQFIDEYKDLPGATKFFRQVRPIYADAAIYEFAVKQFMRMQFTTPPSVAQDRQQSLFKSSLFRYKVVVCEHFDAPHARKWKMGRHVVVVNGDATHITSPSYQVDGRMDGWHPYVEAQWLNAAPSSVAPGPMTDGMRKNREMNVKDSLIATAIRRNMGSQLLVKTGSGIDIDRLTGEPGMSHEVSDPYGARWLHDDMPIPPVLTRLRELDKEDYWESTGAGDALRGQPSTGASSGYQEKQREEREEKRLAPARKGFERAVGLLGSKLISCVRTNVIKLDDHTMGYLMRSAAGGFSTQDVVSFLSAPLTVGVDIKVKKRSMALTSKATQQALLAELASGPASQRLQSSAKVLDKYLDAFDADELRDGSSKHRDRAQRENEAFLDFLRLGPDAEGVMWPVVMFEDDDAIHQEEHTEFVLEYAEELMTNEWLMLRFLTHQEQHRLQEQEKAATLMPGTALQTGNMMAQAAAQPAPTVQAIQQRTMMEASKPQPQQQQPGGAAQGQARAPQAPKTAGGGPPGSGQKATNPGAPSGATPSAASRGGFQ